MSMMSRVKAFLGLDNELDEQIIGTYFNLRLCMGVLAFALPIALCIGGQMQWWLAQPLEIQNSLSAYYHAVPINPCPPSHSGAYRDLFVGILTAISACLIAYRGYTPKENWLLNGAGFFLALVAFFPMGWPPSENQCKGPDGTILSGQGSELFGIHGLQIHFVAAVSFFILLIITVVFTSKTTLIMRQTTISRSLKKRWEWAYNFLSILMLTPIAVLLIGKFLLPTWHASVLWAELTGIIFFGIYWFLKTYEVWQTKVSSLFTTAPS